MTVPAKSVMTTDLVTVLPETTVAEAARKHADPSRHRRTGGGPR
jgi:CBS domain-containing protein